MTDTFGVLGAASTVTAGSLVTVYTVPSGKAARVWLQYIGQAGTGANTSDLNVYVNGTRIFSADNLTQDYYIHTTSAKMANIDSGYPDGTDDANVVSKGPKEYLLSEGDTVQYQIDDLSFQSMDFQVIGAEVDLS